MTNPTDIAAELERLGDQPLEAHHIAQWMEVNYHDLLAALRAAGEVGELRKALAVASENLEQAGNLFEDGRNEEAWEWIATAQLLARRTLGGGT